MTIDIKKVLAETPVFPQVTHLNNQARIAVFAGLPQFMLQPVAITVPYALLKAIVGQIIALEGGNEMQAHGATAQPLVDPNA
jgi:hypothetical protein